MFSCCQSRVENYKYIYSLYFWARNVQETFYLKNQKSGQNAKNSVEKDFYKLINNSNFGYDCRNNRDCRNNYDCCQFVSIYNKIKEITYIKKHYNFFDPKVSKFVTSDLIAQETEEKYNDDRIKLSKEDMFLKIKKFAIHTDKARALDSLKEFDKKVKDKKKEKNSLSLSR